MSNPTNGAVFVETEVPARPKRRSFPGAYKLTILAEADRCVQPGEIGALLRREGLYSSHLVSWREAREKGMLEALSKKRGRKPTETPEAKENRELRRENARLREKLRRAEIIIDVQKKVSEMLDADAPPTETGETD